jgi:hypothetical protein
MEAVCSSKAQQLPTRINSITSWKGGSNLHIFDMVISVINIRLKLEESEI